MVLVGAFANCKDWRFSPVEEQIELNQLYNILQHHAILLGTRLVAQGFVLMQDDDTMNSNKLCQRYIKSKEEQYVLQLIS